MGYGSSVSAAVASEFCKLQYRPPAEPAIVRAFVLYDGTPTYMRPLYTEVFPRIVKAMGTTW